MRARQILTGFLGALGALFVLEDCARAEDIWYFTGVVDTRWSTVANWKDACMGGGDRTRLPRATDPVVICENKLCEVDSSGYAKTITVQSGAALDIVQSRVLSVEGVGVTSLVAQNAILDTHGQLWLKGSVTVDGTANVYGGWDLNAQLTITVGAAGDIALRGGATLDVNESVTLSGAGSIRGEGQPNAVVQMDCYRTLTNKTTLHGNLTVSGSA